MKTTDPEKQKVRDYAAMRLRLQRMSKRVFAKRGRNEIALYFEAEIQNTRDFIKEYFKPKELTEKQRIRRHLAVLIRANRRLERFERDNLQVLDMEKTRIALIAYRNVAKIIGK